MQFTSKEAEARFRQKQNSPDSVYYAPNDPALVQERSQQLAAAIEHERVVRNAQLQHEAKETTVEQEREAFVAEMQRNGRVPYTFLDNVYRDREHNVWVIELQEEGVEEV